MVETTVIARVEHHGQVVGRIVMHDDCDAPCTWEGPHDYCEPAGVTVRAVSLPSGTREDYYETADHSEHDAAWQRITNGENAEGLEQYLRTAGEDVELFTRYMRVFHPMVPVVVRSVQTGYSQGDWANLIAWADRRDDGDPRPAYQIATDDHNAAEDTLRYVGAFARGQFVSVAYEEMTMLDVELGEDTLTASVDWHEDDRVSGVMYLTEFEPEGEALEAARMVIPTGATVVPVVE